MKAPIILAAFGTTSKALDTYEYIEAKVRQKFPDHKIVWAYSSRFVRNTLKKRLLNLNSPEEVVYELQVQGYEWAVMQSLHIMAGHEFYGLLTDNKDNHVRLSMGLPLLYTPEDYQKTSNAFKPIISSHPEHAIIFIGHGSDHHSWSSFPALEQVLQNEYGEKTWVGAIEGSQKKSEIIAKIKKAGFTNVLLVPLLLVAGVHFHEDLMGEEPDSWKSLLAAEDIKVDAIKDCLGKMDEIIDIYCQHIQEALECVLED